MSQGDLVQRMERLLADRVPFVTATVVRAAKPLWIWPSTIIGLMRTPQSSTEMKRRSLISPVPGSTSTTQI